MSEKNINILITSAGRRSYLVEYFKKALGGRGKVYASNSTDISPAFLVADEYVVTPLIYDHEYIPFLVGYCKEHHIDALVSVLDIDIPILARNREKFERAGTRLLMSDIKVADICNDKWHTFQFLKENGFHVPKTYLSVADAKLAVSAHELLYPVVVKPRWGTGSAAIYYAENEEELTILYRKAKNDIFQSFLKYESSGNRQNCVLIQEQIIGQEYGLDIVNDLNGRYQTTIQKMKYAMRSGETDCAITVSNKMLSDLGRRIGTVMHHIANMDTDVIIRENIPYVLEMNARFGGGYPFGHIAGADLPRAIVEWLRGRTDVSEYLQYKAGVVGQKDLCIRNLKGVWHY